MYFASRFYLLLWSVCLFVVFFVHVLLFFLFFFFQAEDGIRDHCVTGVQTCALPIWPARPTRPSTAPSAGSGIAAGLPGSASMPWWESCRSRGAGRPRCGAAIAPRGEIGRASCRERV